VRRAPLPISAAVAAIAAVAAVAAVVAVSLPATAYAHQSSVKYVDITATTGATADGALARVRFAVAPADLTAALGLPDNATPTAADVTTPAAAPAAAAYVSRWLALALAPPGGAPCIPGPAHAAPDPDGRLVAVTWDAACPAPISRLRIDLTPFFAADARHIALVTLHAPGAHVDPHVVRADQPVVELAAGQAPSLASWIALGAHHIFGGTDHVCFVLALLLVVVIARAAPAATAAPAARWQPRPPRAALRATAAIVTSFTAAHSLTLAAASLGWLRLPGPLVESAIAASILYTAAEDVIRPDARHRFAMTFAFGLVHGLGFASVLEDRLPPDAVAVPLFGFNLGVELGQLAIVAVALPTLAGLARLLGSDQYRRYFLPAAALPLGVISIKWLIERALGL